MEKILDIKIMQEEVFPKKPEVLKNNKRRIALVTDTYFIKWTGLEKVPELGS